MKKESAISAKRGLITVFLFSVVLLVNCDMRLSGDESEAGGGRVRVLGAFRSLDADLEGQILQSKLQLKIDAHTPNDPMPSINDIWVSGFYGIYNGAVAISLDCDCCVRLISPLYVVVADILFAFHSGFFVLVWKNGIFYDLREAYNMGLLTLGDLKSIYDRHRAKFQNTSVNGGLGTFPGLDAGLEMRILLSEFQLKIAMLPPHLTWRHHVDNIWVGGFYGIYNGAVAVSLYCCARPDAILRMDVADVFFVFPQSDRYYIVIWKDGNLYSLQEAYDADLLTREELKVIRDRFTARFQWR